jgi:hypothetical protein
MSDRAVQHSSELDRILRLPKRTWEEQGEEYARELTAYLRRPGGTMSLRPFQAACLAEFYDTGGLLAQGPVGCGKSLPALLYVLVLSLHPDPPQRPWLVVPAHMREDTYRDAIEKYGRHWQLPNLRVGVSSIAPPQGALTIVTYNEISVAAGTARLQTGQPDAIFFDEAHCVKNTEASCTRTFHSYITKRRKAGERVRVAAVSGTMAKRSLHDLWHIAYWCRPDMFPLPHHYPTLEDWALALDEKIGDRERVDPGALVLFAEDFGVKREGLEDERSLARRGVQRRIFSTPGFLTSKAAEVDCSLSVIGIEVPPTPKIDAAFQQLRELNETPDGWPTSDALSVWRHATELALGFYTYWSPRPPQEWIDARRAWAAAVREMLDPYHQLDLTSEHRVALALARTHGAKPDGMRSEQWHGLWHPAWLAYEQWRGVRPLFTPPKEPPAEWIDESVLAHVAAWKGPGVVWSWHRQFAKRLSAVTGWPWYEAGGLNARGQHIIDADPKLTVIASIGSNSSGRNLQFWSRSLVVFPPTTGGVWQQLLGRMHRSGQEADEVVYEVLLGCKEHVEGIEQARRDAAFHRTLLDSPAKLEYCSVVMPTIRSAGSWAFRSKKS